MPCIAKAKQDNNDIKNQKQNTIIMRHLIYIMALAMITLNANAQTAGLFGRNRTQNAKNMDYTPYADQSEFITDGKVVFTKSFDTTGKDKAQIYRALASWASARYMPEVENGKWNDPDYFRNLKFSSIREANEATGYIVCQGSEEQVFSNKLLSKDFTEMEYTLELNITGQSVKATIKNIVYNYTFASSLERRPAEEVITDEYVFTNKGKWIKSMRKFRVKTIDLAHELFNEIEKTVK